MMEIVGDIVLPVSLAFIMYGMGLSLSVEDFKRVLRRRLPVTMGVISMMLIVPLVGVFFAVWFSPSPVLSVGIVLLATCPGGMLSNLMTDLVGGDLALSVSMTVVVSAVYVCIIPLIASGSVGYFLGDDSNIDFPMFNSFLKILTLTLVPVTFGMLTREKFRKFSEKARPIIKTLSTSFLVVAFSIIVFNQMDVIRENFNNLILIVAALNVSAISIAYAISKLGKLSKEETIAVCIEHSIRQEGTAMFIAVSLLNSYEMSIPMILNTLVGMVVCVTFILFFKRKKSF